MTLFSFPLTGNPADIKSTLDNFAAAHNIAPGDTGAVYRVEDSDLTAARSVSGMVEIGDLRGYGVNYPWGVGWSSYTVTTLNNSGAGSLRAALESTTSYVIDLGVSGYIDLESTIAVKSNKWVKPHATNAVTLRPAAGFTAGLMQIRPASGAVQNVLLQNMRLRGDENMADGPQLVNIDNTAGQQGTVNRIIFANCSFSWVGESNLVGINNNSYGAITNIAFHRCLFAEPLLAHPTGFNAVGDYDLSGQHLTSNVSLNRCLFAHSDHRNPLLTTNGAKVVNCLMYNYGGKLGGVTRDGVADWINCYFKTGPLSNAASVRLRHEYFTGFNDPSIYMSGNDDDELGSSDQWSFWVRIEFPAGTTVALPESCHRATPLTPPVPDFEYLAAGAIETDILADVGCSVEDAIDARIKADVSAGTYEIGGSPQSNYPSTVAEAGGWPTL